MSKPLIIPIFIPHFGCPHQCAFCNQSIITNKKSLLPDADTIKCEVESYLKFKGTRTKVELAFFGGNFLGLKKDEILNLLNCTQEFIKKKSIDSIRFSTRPDTISTENLEFIKQFDVSTIELGVQSMDDDVLLKAIRGHTAYDTIKAVALLKKYKFQVGIQMMVGLPSDTDKNALKNANEIAKLCPDFIRIYPLMVLKGSLIAKWYQLGQYTPMTLEKCVSLVKDIFKVFNKKDIPVIRMGLQASDILQDSNSMLAGPWHPAFGHLVFSEIFFDKIFDLINDLSKTKLSKIITLRVHPSSLSRLRGDKNYNMERLKVIYPFTSFKTKTDDSLNKDMVMIAS